MFNKENAYHIGDTIGRCVAVESVEIMKLRPYLRVRVEVDVSTPLMEGFNWSNSTGQEKWVAIKYERLFDFFYGCGRLGHTSQSCNEEIAVSATNPNLPKYGSWLVGVRQRANIHPIQVGGRPEDTRLRRDPLRPL